MIFVVYLGLYFNQIGGIIIIKLLRNMMTSDSVPRKYLYILFVIAIIAVLFALVIFILLTALDFIGFNGSSPVSTTACNHNYFTTKYYQLTVFIKTSYLCSIFCLVTFGVVLALLIKKVLRANKSEQANIFIPKCTKITIYILTCVAIMTTIPTLGYYLNFMIQLHGCSTTYDNSKVAAVFALSLILLCLLLTFLILLFVFLNQTVDKNYGQVERTSTEPVQPAQQPKYVSKKYIQKEQPRKRQPQVYERTPHEHSRNSPPRKTINNGQQLEHTNQNLNNLPSRQPTINVYSKRTDPVENKYSHQVRNNPSKQPPPILEPRTYKKQPFRMEENSRQLAPSKEGELVYSKARRNNANDSEEFNKQQSRFMSNYGAKPILAYSGVEESGISKRQINSYFDREEPLPRKNVQATSPTRKGREHGLLNYIRGKYAN